MDPKIKLLSIIEEEIVLAQRDINDNSDTLNHRRYWQNRRDELLDRWLELVTLDS